MLTQKHVSTSSPLLSFLLLLLMLLLLLLLLLLLSVVRTVLDFSGVENDPKKNNKEKQKKERRSRRRWQMLVQFLVSSSFISLFFTIFFGNLASASLGFLWEYHADMFYWLVKKKEPFHSYMSYFRVSEMVGSIFFCSCFFLYFK